MTRRLVSGALIGALATAFAGTSAAQMADPKGYVGGTAPASPGYVGNAYPTPTDGTVKSGVYNGTKGLAGNLCYRTGFWTPAMATMECDPDLVPKPPAPAPAPAVVPPPPPRRLLPRRPLRHRKCRRSRWRRRHCSTSTRRC